VQIGGPTGAFVVIVAGVIAAHGYSGLVLATLMAGAILIVAGYAGVGRLMRFVPMPVVTGFTAGIAVIIASSQVGDFLGLRLQAPVEFIEKWAAYLDALGQADPATVLGLGTLPFMDCGCAAPARLSIAIRRHAAAALLHLPVETVGFASGHAGRPRPRISRHLAASRRLLPSAFTIAFLPASSLPGGRGRRHDRLPPPLG
jgi:SulP family sulfate permease